MRPRRIATYSLAVTAAALPLYVVRFHVGPLPTTLLEVLILVTVATYAWTMWSERRRPAARTPYDIPIVLLLVAGVIGIAVAPDHVRALGIYRAYFLEAIAVFYIAVDLVRTREQLRTVLLVAAAGYALFAVGQIISFANVFAHHAIQIDAPPAFLNTSSNSVALYLEPPLAFAVGFVLFPDTKRERLLGLGFGTVYLTALVLALSRASYVALAFLAVTAILTASSSRARLWIAGALALIGLVVLELPFTATRLGTFGHSIQLRMSIYSEALRMLSTRPLTGAGISGFPVRVAPYRPSGEEVELYPHNIWLTTWSELGLLGLVSFAVVFFGLLWRGLRAVGREDLVLRSVAWGSTGAIVLYLIHGLFDSPYWKNDLAVEFWLIAALQVIALRGVSAWEQSSPSARRP